MTVARIPGRYVYNVARLKSLYLVPRSVIISRSRQEHPNVPLANHSLIRDVSDPSIRYFATAVVTFCARRWFFAHAQHARTRSLSVVHDSNRRYSFPERNDVSTRDRSRLFYKLSNVNISTGVRPLPDCTRGCCFQGYFIYVFCAAPRAGRAELASSVIHLRATVRDGRDRCSSLQCDVFRGRTSGKYISRDLFVRSGRHRGIEGTECESVREK